MVYAKTFRYNDECNHLIDQILQIRDDVDESEFQKHFIKLHESSPVPAIQLLRGMLACARDGKLFPWERRKAA